jgi:gas vesicle protein
MVMRFELWFLIGMAVGVGSMVALQFAIQYVRFLRKKRGK